jgi:hypothetical protein
MSSLVSKAQDVSCVTGISIQHVIKSVITCCIEIPVTQGTYCVLETRLDIHEQVIHYMLNVFCVTGISIQHVINDLLMNVKSSHKHKIRPVP